MNLLFDGRVGLQADVPNDPSWGLRGRVSLAPDTGMLFVSGGPMTMRNTDMPLDIAFVKNGVLTSIHSVAARYPGLVHGDGEYVVEAAFGFFSAHGVRPGMSAKGLEFLALFAQQRALFSRWYPRAGQTQLELTSSACVQPGFCSNRDFAYAERDRNAITFQVRFLSYPVENKVALLRHELGHIVDSVPYVINTGGEQRADDIAERVTHQKIRYDADLIQTTGPGLYPRPTGIHS